MHCSECGRLLKSGELFCLNCGQPTQYSMPGKRERPSDVVGCLVIGMFFFFGIPALLFGSYLMAVGTGYISPAKRGAWNGLAPILISLVPLGVFVALTFLVVKVGIARKRGE